VDIPAEQATNATADASTAALPRTFFIGDLLKDFLELMGCFECCFDAVGSITDGERVYSGQYSEALLRLRQSLGRF
jgi:hypothetical protein